MDAAIRTATGRMLRAGRLARRWSVTKAAAELKVMRRTIYDWETGHSVPPSRRLWMLVRLLELDATELLQSLDEAPPCNTPAAHR